MRKTETGRQTSTRAATHAHVCYVGFKFLTRRGVTAAWRTDFAPAGARTTAEFSFPGSALFTYVKRQEEGWKTYSVQ